MIHSTAVIEKGAELGRNVSVGAHSVIGPEVRLADGCEVRCGATILGKTTIGEGCVFFTGCVIGEIPQDLKFKGEKTETVIGDDNHFREFVTVHAGTALGGGVTRIGNHNRFLVAMHLAHDVVVGNDVVISNSVQIAGHVHIEDRVTMGGQCGIHHFVTVGKYAMLGGFSRVITDAPPYMISLGYPSQVRGVNFHALKRWSLPQPDIDMLAKAYKLLYSKRADENVPFIERLERLEQSDGSNDHVRHLSEFLRRTLAVGNCGRHLESLRRDSPEDNREFFSKRLDCDSLSAEPSDAGESGGATG